jgi:hypothetical protein
MAQTKGTGFLNIRSFVTDQFGAGSYGSVIQGMAPEDRAVLESLVPVGWYDLALYARLIRAVDERFGVGDLRLVHALGRFEAERDLTTVHQFFLRLMRPTLAIEQMNKYWRRFHDSGDWSTVWGARDVTSCLSGWGVVDAALCRELVGYLGRTLELLGARDVHMDHRKCRVRGDALCEFHGVWRHSEDAGGAPSAKDAASSGGYVPSSSA